MTYTLTNGTAVIRDADQTIIPDDAGNADWQAYQAWLAAGNVPSPVAAPSALALAKAQYMAAVATGLEVTWQTSAALNGTYALGTDPITGQSAQVLINFELASFSRNNTFTNGQTTRNWPDASGAFHLFTIAQFEAFATALALYVDQLATAVATAAEGGTPSWPASSVAIDQ